MNCKCFETVNEKLREKNLKLSGYAFMTPNLELVPVIATQWLNPALAPRGRKRSPTSMFVSYCPFCGVKIEIEPEEPEPTSEAKESVA